MGILRNRYVRCFIAAGIGSAVAPSVSKLLNWTIPELTPSDGVINDVEYGSIIGIIAGMTAVLLAAAFGVPEGGSEPAKSTPPAGAAPAGAAS